MKLHPQLAAFTAALFLLSGLTLAGHTQAETKHQTQITFDEPWVVFHPGTGPSRDQIAIVPNENGRKTLEYNVKREGDELLVSPAFPIRNFSKLTFSLWSKQRTMLVAVVEDRDGATFHAPIPTSDNQWTEVSLTPNQFTINDDSKVKKAALDQSLLQSKLLLCDAGKMLGNRDPNLLKFRDMQVTYAEGKPSPNKPQASDGQTSPQNTQFIRNSRKSTPAMLPSQQSLRARIQGLRPSNLVWHQIPWKTSVTEAVQEARRTHKPIFVWAFIHLPQDERC